MKKTAIVYSPRYLDHDPGPNHYESPRRLRTIIGGLRESGLLEHENCSIIEPQTASLKDLELVHSSGYIEFVRKTSESGGGLLAEQTVASRESFEVARLAAGGAIDAVNKVMAKDFCNAFALVRPPGHHAGPDYALGFCLFNNVALAAAHLLRRYCLNRILVLDIDAHHGNGTQEIFYDTDKVLYVSLHEDPSEFPETGFVDETGEGTGAGYTVNIPFPYGTGDPAYLKAMKRLVIPIVQQYKPQFILVSAGFDGYYKDSIAELSLSAYVYPRIFQMVLDLAHRFCGDRVVAVLEGGYSLPFLRKIVPSITAQMAGLNVGVRDRRPLLNWDAQREAEKIIEYVRKVQSCFWEL
jgi:acetoin utilization deacetylase AcuC-like enzyme